MGPSGSRRWHPQRLVLATLLLLMMTLAAAASASKAPAAFQARPPGLAASRASPRRRLLAPLPRSTAHAAAADAEGSEPIYQGFWREGLAMLQQAFPTTLEGIDDIPPELTTARCALPPPKGAKANKDIKQPPPKAQPGGAAAGGDQEGGTLVEVHAFRVPGVIRLARAAVLSTTPAALPPQVLNFVIFPDPALDAPILGADLVQLPGGHLIVLDFQPVAPPLASADTSLAAGGRFERRLGAIRAKYAGVLPDGGGLPEAARPFFSPHFLFTRVEATAAGHATVRATVREAYHEYLALYLELLKAAAAQGPIRDAGRAAEVRRGHVAYMTYRAANDPARGMLTRMFGPEWTERLIHEVLFDWAERGEGGGGGGGGK